MDNINFNNELIKDLPLEKVVSLKAMKLVLYSADWCGMCKALKANLHKDRPICQLTIYTGTSDNQDEFLDKTESLNIKHLPTLILYKDDKEIEELTRWNGVVKTTVINDYIIKYLNNE